MATITVTNPSKNILSINNTGSFRIGVCVTTSDIENYSLYKYAWRLYIGTTILADTTSVRKDVATVAYPEIVGINNTKIIEAFPSNSDSATAYCEVFLYKSGTVVSSSRVKLTAKLHDNVKPSIGDLFLNPENVTISNTSCNILLSNYNKFGVYVGYTGVDKNTRKGTAWSATPGSSIDYYTISGPGIATTKVSTTSGYTRHTFNSVDLNNRTTENDELKYTITIVDKRKRTNSITVTNKDTSVTSKDGTTTYDRSFQWYKYNLPTFDVNALYRCASNGAKDENNGTYAYIDITPIFNSIGGRNTISGYCYLDNNKQKNYFSTYYFSRFSLGSTSTIALGEHKISFGVIDGLGNSMDLIYTIKNVSRIINVKSSGLGIAFGKISENDQKLESAWTIIGSTENGSDRRIKTDITTIDNDIVDNLAPVQYKFIDATENRIHYGFIAQDVVQALEDQGIDAESVGLVGHIMRNGEQLYTLAYTEFIPLVVKKCQELQKENNEMRAEIAEIKSMLLSHNSE